MIALGQRRAMGVLIVSVVFLAVSHHASATEPPAAENGVLDLSNYDFAESGALDLSGEWHIYWWPASGDGPPDGRPDGVFEMPSTWDDWELDGEAVGGLGHAFFSLQVLLPEDLERVAMLVPNASTAYRLDANGSEVASSGSPGATRATSQPYYRVTTTEVPVVDGILDLELEVSNFHHRRGGMWKPITIGLPDQIRTIDAAEYMYDILLLGSFLALAVSNLVSYLTSSSRPKGALLLAIAFFAMALRMFVTGQMLATRLLPGFPWRLQLRIEYLTAQSVFMLLAWIIDIVYPKLLPRWAIWAITGFVAINAVITVFFPVLTYSRVVGYYNLVKGTTLLAIAVRFVVAAVRGKRDAWAMVGAIIIFMLITFGETLHYGEIIVSREFAPLGFIITLIAGESSRHTGLYFLSTMLTLGAIIVLFNLVVFRVSRSFLSLEFKQTPLDASALAAECGLTRRETEILQVVAEGLSNKEVGAKLHISEGTVKNHLHSIMKKTQVGNRTELVLRLRS